jgi:hypothetical protein
MYASMQTRNLDASDHRSIMAASLQQHEIRRCEPTSVNDSTDCDRHESASTFALTGRALPKSDNNNKLGGMIRTKSLFGISMEDELNGDQDDASCNCHSISASSSSLESAASSQQDHASGTDSAIITSGIENHNPDHRYRPLMELDFVPDLRRCVGDSPHPPNFGSSALRKVMEPHLRRARLLREKARNRFIYPSSSSSGAAAVAPSIAGSMGIPYTALPPAARNPRGRAARDRPVAAAHCYPCVRSRPPPASHRCECSESVSLCLRSLCNVLLHPPLTFDGDLQMYLPTICQ